FGLSINVAEGPLPLLFGRCASELERLEIQADLCDRRSQFMRYARHEISAKRRELSFSSKLHDRNDRQRCREPEQAEEEGKSRLRQTTNEQRACDIWPNRGIDVEASEPR